MGDKSVRNSFGESDFNNPDSANNSSVFRLRIHRLREEVEKYGELCDEMSRAAEIEHHLTSEAEIELNALRNRLPNLENECEQKHVQLQKVLLQLGEATKTLEANERGRHLAESIVLANEDRITTLQDLLRQAQAVFASTEQRYLDMERKVQLVTVEIDRCAGRTAAIESKNEAIERELQAMGSKYRALQSASEQSTQQDLYYEDQIQNLVARLRSADNRADEFNRTAMRLHLIVNTLEDELEEVKRQRYAVEDDIEHNMGQLSVSRSVSRAVSRASSIGPRSTTGSIRPRSMSGSSSKHNARF